MVSVLKAFKTPRNIADQDLVPAERASPLRDRPVPTHFAKCVGTRSQPKFLSVVKERDLPDSPGPVRSALQPGCASGSRQSRRRAFRTAKQKGAGKKLRLAFSNARIMVTIPDYYVDTTLGVDGRVAADAAQSDRSSAPGACAPG